MVAPAQQITSPTNPRVKALVRLRDRREREQEGRFLVEELLVIARARAAGCPFLEVWACPELLDAEGTALYAALRSDGVPAVEAPAAVLHKLAYRERSEGLLAVAARRSRTLADLELPAAPPPLVVVLEDVEKPGNLGAVLRIADGVGAHAVLAVGGADLDNPNVLRASRGAYFTVPTVAAPRQEIIAWLRDHGVRLVAASPDGADLWDACDLTGPVALVLGAEHEGLSAALRADCDDTVCIPMHGAGDSLNVATAAAILLYEAARQRRARERAGSR
ncbi:MAG: RNA methyltransferase [bacterium]|nr:RNA methyltransferase [bacterium]